MKTKVMILPAQNGFAGDGFAKWEGRFLTVCVRGNPGGSVWWCTEDDEQPLTERRGDVLLCRFTVGAVIPESGAVIAVRERRAICLLGTGDFQKLTKVFAEKHGFREADYAVTASTDADHEQKILPETTEAADRTNTDRTALSVQTSALTGLSDDGQNSEKETAVPKEKETVPFKASDERTVESPAAEPSPVVQWAPPEPLTPPRSFWDCNASAMERFFEEQPAEEELAMLIPGSRWAQVANDGAPYIVGMIYDDDREPLFLCYGFPMPWSEDPPEVLEGYSQWVPKDFAHPHDDGYWMIYVNARTGERVT